MPSSSPDEPSRALVIGASIAGLLAARVLSDHFERVTLIERDRLPAEPEPRVGVPQSRHFHGLLVGGYLVLEQLFPGFGAEMQAAGALPVDLALDVAWYTPAGWGVRFPSSLQTIAGTRSLLEWGIRRSVSRIGRIEILPERGVTGFHVSPEGVVGGVRLQRRGTGSADEELLVGDLVVDAGGRGSRTPQWLSELGYPQPEETVVNGRLGYLSRLYRRPKGFQPDWKVLYCQLAPPKRPRGGVMAEMEGDSWIVTLIGGGGDYPPTDEAEMLEFARSLPVPVLYELMRDAEPLGPIVGHRATENRLRHYERLARFPPGLLVLGDAACAFNPVYGQGMTAAALAARALGAVLEARKRKGVSPDRDPDLWREFQKRLARENQLPWLLATGEDFRFEGTIGKTPGGMTPLMHRYVDAMTRLSTRDRHTREALLGVFSLAAPPSALLHPALLLRGMGDAMSAHRVPEPVSGSRPDPIARPPASDPSQGDGSGTGRQHDPSRE